MLKLRSARVVEVLDVPGSSACDTVPDTEQSLVVELASPFGDARERRRAIADVGLVGTAEVGDEVVVNVEALDLGLGSGGFDVVHVNLTRGLSASGDGAYGDRGAMKLNYTSLQHLVEPVDDETLELPVGRPVAVLALHGQLAPLAWAFSIQAPDQRLGYVQTEGGALPGWALEGRAGAAWAGTARRSLDSRRRLRRRGRGGEHRGCPPPRPDEARLGRGRVRPRTGDLGIRVGARPRRHGRARLGSRVARPGLPDAGGGEDVLERRTRAPSRASPTTR